MKRLLGTIILLLILGNTINAVTDGISFNENWRFFKGEIKGAKLYRSMMIRGENLTYLMTGQ